MPSTLPTLNVFEHDPDLLEGAPPDLAEVLRSTIATTAIEARPGRWRPPEPIANGFGLLVLDGWMSRRERVGTGAVAEIVGPGDVLRPQLELQAPSFPRTVEWHVETPARLAVLDGRFVRQALRWPPVAMALTDRTIERSRRLALLAAIRDAHPIEPRVLLALWLLADSWGRVTREGVRLDLPLPHRLIAMIVGASRPTVSSAASALKREGRAERVASGWLLHPPAPAASNGSAPVCGAA